MERRIIDIYQTDTFHAVAERVYENEVSMLVEAIDKCHDSDLEIISPGTYELHKRMLEKIEKDLLKIFEQYKRIHANE